MKKKPLDVMFYIGLQTQLDLRKESRKQESPILKQIRSL